MNQVPRLGKRELICLLLFTCNYVVSALPLGAWDGLRFYIVALPEPSINYFVNATYFLSIQFIKAYLQYVCNISVKF